MRTINSYGSGKEYMEVIFCLRKLTIRDPIQKKKNREDSTDRLLAVKERFVKDPEIKNHFFSSCCIHLKGVLNKKGWNAYN